MHILEDKVMVPRRRANSEIKLLRLELIPHGKTICEDIHDEWTVAQPAENLSPAKAALALAVEVWAPASVVKKRYRTLQLRYPPDQFIDKHTEWRPAADLLSKARKRLNWFWHSGFIPLAVSSLPFKSDNLWDIENTEEVIESKQALDRLLS